MRPGTGQRIYLGETYTPHTSGSYGSTDYDSDSASKDGEYLEITEFDVTHLLPVWALIVRTVNEPHSGETSNRVPAAYIHYDAFTGRPHLVGRWPGRVMLGLVATLDDSQPLASTYVDIGRRGQNESRGGTMTEDTISVAAIRAECVNQNLILSGQLDPASPTTGVFDSSFRGSGSLSFQGVTDLRSATDYSLPTPHRLSIDLNVAGSGGDSLVTAAASSAVRSPEALRSIFSQKWTNPTKPIGSSSSSATCPVQLLAVSLVMSDNSVLPAHQVPPNYLRISSLDSDLVWDPAIPTQPAIGYAKNSVETSSASVYVRVNSLVVWTSYSQSKQETGFHRSVPLGAMDDVVLAVQSGHVLRDPGPAQDPSKWFHRAHETPIDRREAVALNNHNTIEGTSGRYSIWSSPVGQSDFKTMFVSAQNANKRHSLYDSTGGQDSRPSNFITHILIWVGAIAVLLFAVNCTVLLALKKRRRTRTSHEAQADANQHQYSGLQDGKTKRTGVGRVDLYNVEDNECTVKANGSAELSNMTAGSPVIPCSQFGYLPSYSDVHSSHRMMMMDSSSAQQVDTMTGGLSCSSMGSTHSGPVGSLKQSMVMDPVVNPYLMMSEGSSMGASQSNKNSHSVNAPSFHCVPFGPVGYRPGGISNSPSSWNSPASMTPAVYQKTLPNTSPMQTASAASPSPGHIWPASLSPTNSGPCNPGYTSGLGSVGTCEGCSDEGVASGFEMISLSQEVVNITGNNGLHAAYPQLTRGPSGVVGRVATGGTNSTTSGGSANGTRTGLAHRVQMSTFKRSPTSGLGAGSLSGGSSSADASEFRVHRTPESGGLNEVEMGPQLASRGSIPSDVMYLHHLPSNRFQASPTVPPPIRSNLMTESFSGDKSTTEFGMPTSYPEKNLPEFSDAILHESGVRHHPSLRKNHSTMTKENPSSHKAHILSSPPGSDMGRDLSSSEDLEDTPVPMPPALLLNSHSCFGALNNHNRPFVSTNRQKVLRPSSPLESGLNLGSYKRSDSFGMATKIHPNDSLSPFGGNTAFGEFSKDRSAEPNPYPTSGGQTSVGFGMHGEMVGDTLDTSDEVSSGSKSSSARHGDNKYSKLSGQPRSNTKDPSEITYLHSIPPPEL
ncbi:hypothetical protein D915_009468 [Fasciola hepatica]|uniref:Uncharacterized protein n=1 Tax=Fasciola hepatica TaxID=6192 RepID=A0A2H1BW34_FASHE|nr:hypothetical protein D915_009468 [Fasciola hepatica]